MKNLSLALAGSALIMGLGLSGLALAEPGKPVVVEGRDAPILLARVVVTATPLDDAGR
jgi:hypothetical protein